LRRSARFRSALLFCAASLTLPAVGAAQATSAYEEGIVEVVAERLAPLPLVVLVDSAGSILLPVEHITYYLGFVTSWDGPVFNVPTTGGGSARIDTVSNTLTVGANPVQLAPAEIVQHGPLLYLRASRVAELLEARIGVDFATLTVAITRDRLFPAQQRIVAEQRRAVVLARQRHLEQRLDLQSAPYPAASGGAIVDWDIATYDIDPTRLTSIRTFTGVALLGGDLTGGLALDAGSDASDHIRDTTLRYHRAIPGGRYFTQFSVGDLHTTGLLTRFVRGAEFSNRPFLRSAELSEVLVQPDLPAGWEYEVFQGNQLLGYSDIASFDPVSVPLRAGTTPVQVRMYGPAGEEVVTTLLYQTPVSLLQRDDIEYSIGGGECFFSCDAFAHADVRYGVTSLFTAGGGIEVFRDSVGSRIRPYFVYSMASGVRATAELTYMPFELYSANVAIFPRDGSRANLRGSISRPGLGPITLVSHNRMRWDAEGFWDETIEREGSRFSQLRFGASASGGLGDLDRWRVSSLGSFSRGFIEARYDHDNAAARAHLLTGRAAIHVPVRIRTRTLRPLINGAIGVGDNGVRLAETGLSIQPRTNAAITAGVQWQRGYSRPTLSLGYSARTGSVQSALRAVSSASGVASSSFRVSGSTAVARDGSFTTQPMARTGYAGLHGVVFIDHDADGVFSAGDETVSDAHIIVGSYRTATDENGRFRVWGMHPYEPVPVAIDSARTPDPSLITSRSGMVVRPTPNMARRFDIPLTRTRELIGTVTATPEVATVAGITIEITDLDAGTSVTTATFSDGLFYVSRIRPGRYRISVSRASLDALGVGAEPQSMDVTIPATGDDLVVELPPVRLHR
jgi:hypothetical protein